MVGRRTELRFHPALLTLLAALVFACFTLGYHHGASEWERGFFPTALQYKERERLYTDMFKKCDKELHELIGKLSMKNETIRSIFSQNTEVASKLERMLDEFSAISINDEKCTSELAFMVEKAKEEANAPDESIKVLEDRLKRLRGSLNNLTDGGGMNSVAIFASLQKMREKYVRMCSKFPGCTIFSDNSLLLRWGAFLKELPLRRQESEVNTMKKMHWFYDALSVQDIESIFLPKDEMTAPTFFGRTGNLPVTLVGEAKIGEIVAKTMDRLQVVRDVAICAYRLRDPKVFVESIFEWAAPSEGSHTALCDLLQSPLIVFCMECSGADNNITFWKKCEETATEDDFYGRRNYWAARSMVRPHPAVVHDVKSYYAEHSLQDRKVLAVVAQNSMEDCLKLRGDVRWKHFLYLAANFPTTNASLENHVSSETIFQCSPTTAQLVQRITDVLEEETRKGKTSFDNIYFSVSDEIMQDLNELEDKPNWWGIVLRRVGAITSAHSELVDLTIASQAGALLVSPYFAPSQYVVEAFLLLHELRPMDHVWFF